MGPLLTVSVEDVGADVERGGGYCWWEFNVGGWLCWWWAMVENIVLGKFI